MIDGPTESTDSNFSVGKQFSRGWLWFVFRVMLTVCFSAGGRVGLTEGILYPPSPCQGEGGG